MNTDKKTDGALSVEDTLKLALEALQTAHLAVEDDMLADEIQQAITAIRAALASKSEALAEQPAQQCGYPYCGCNSKAWCKLERMAENARELGLDYEPAQQQEPWVGLTDAEFQWIYDNGRTPAGMIEMAEAKLKEKNDF